MNSKKLLRYADDLGTALDPNRAYMQLLESLEVESSKLRPLIGRLVLPFNNASDAHAASQKLMTEADNSNEIIRKAFPRSVFSGIDFLEEILSQIKADSDFSSRFDVETALLMLATFADSYETFTQSHSRPRSYAVIVDGSKLLIELKRLRSTCSLIQSILRPDPSVISEDEEILSMYFSSPADVAVFSEKLAAINRIYVEYCELVDPSLTSHPLRFERAESGSLILVLIGKAIGIQGLRIIFSRVASYCYLHYTDEGRLELLSRKADEVDKILRLSEELRRRGLDTTAIDARLTKALVKIAGELNTALGGEEAIELDGEAFPLTPNAQRLALANRSMKMLRETNPPDDSSEAQPA